jgi:replication initiation protein RepC
MKAFPLAMILQACPEIVNLGPTGSIDNWRELMVSAVSVRSIWYKSKCL